MEVEWDIDERIPRFELKEIVVQSSPLPNPDSEHSEVNNNSDSAGRDIPTNLPPSEESNSCDYRGLSAIKLDDSEDGSNQEQPSSSSKPESHDAQVPEVMEDKALWSANCKESLSKRIPGIFNMSSHVFNILTTSGTIVL